MQVGGVGEAGAGGGGGRVGPDQLARLLALTELAERVELEQRVVGQLVGDGGDLPRGEVRGEMDPRHGAGRR
jgi:hypothetical protein